MSTFAQLRAAWDAWYATVLPTVPVSWSMDPQPMLLKLPVRVELDGPHTLANTHDRDARTYDNTGTESLVALRTGTITLRAISRDHVHSPAELTLERLRAGLRRTDTLAILQAVDCSVRRVGPSARYYNNFQNRDEAVAACEVTIGWLWTDDAPSTSPAFGTIEHVELTGDPGGTAILDR